MLALSPSSGGASIGKPRFDRRKNHTTVAGLHVGDLRRA
jgi:hypothetical protein